MKFKPITTDHRTFTDKLYDAMQAHGIEIYGSVDMGAYGVWQRFRNAKTPGKHSKDLFVIIHEGGEGATFGDWHHPEHWATVFHHSLRELSVSDLEQRREMQILRARAILQERREREDRARACFNRLYTRRYLVEGDHPYITRKRIKPYYARMVRSWLLVPVRDVNYNLRTVQIIKPDGFKRLWKGTSHKENMVWLSEKLPYHYDSIIRVCEGYATGCTIYEAIGAPVVCALNCNNMHAVVSVLRETYPAAIIKVCADNDKWKDKNAGLDAARAISKEYGLMIYYPDFTGMDISESPTDFNDLFCLAGIECVERQLIVSRKV